MTINYQMAADAAIVLKYGDADQSVVKGLNSLKPYGFTRSVVTVDEFRNAMGRQFAGSGTISNIDYGGNYVTGDNLGQDQLKAYTLANTKFTDCRVYLNLEDFFMPDTAADPLAAFQVVDHSPGNADKNAVFSLSGALACNGQPSTFHIHMTAGTLAITAGTPDTITDSDSGFVTAGFKAGDTVILEDPTAAGDKLAMRTIATVEAGVLTLSNTGADLTAQTAGTSLTIHGGRF
jgi:hypothetical protein